MIPVKYQKWKSYYMYYKINGQLNSKYFFLFLSCKNEWMPKWAIFQIYHGKNKLYVQWDDIIQDVEQEVLKDSSEYQKYWWYITIQVGVWMI